MKKVILSILFFLTVTVVWAQVPQQISYQSVIREGNNVVVASSQVGIKISMLKGSVLGPAVYVETHRKTTNANGLVSLEIGTGTVLSGSFASIDWANGPYLIQTETDPTGGTNYSIAALLTLNSVPYALYAANGTPGPKGDKGDPGAIGDKGDRGATGLTGPQGPIGLTGPAGAVGDKGDTGPAGSTGAAGANGVAGTDGKTVKNGTSNPVSSIGVDGDFYINTATNTLFGPKANGAWPSGVSLVGPQGATGAQGSTGPVGAQGIQGPTGATGAAGPAPSGTGLVTVNNGSLQSPGALEGDVTTSGGGLTTTIGAAKVTNNMLAGSIDLTSKVTGALPVANGGTGLNTTPTYGQLDIGNGSGFTRTTLTAGTGISITNASGAITIASSESSSGVPYTNATGPVNLGAYDLTVHGITVGRGSNGNSNVATDGSTNTAIGMGVLGSNTTGYDNTGIGYLALTYNREGFENTAIGYGALKGAGGSNIGANSNTAVGSFSLLSNRTGSGNTAIGHRSLIENTTGIKNTANGSGAGEFIADGSTKNTNSDYSVYVGSNTKASADDAQNEIVIGYNAIGAGSNTVQLGNTSITNVKTSGTITAGTVTYPNAHNTTAGQVLTTNAAGVASWTTPDPGLPTSSNTPGDMLYWNGSAWVKVAAGSNGQTLSFYNGAPVWTGNANTVASVVSTTGKIWMDRNLGASQVATSSIDVASYGDLYQWGRGTDGHQIRTSAITATLSSSDQPGNGNFITSSGDWRSSINDNLWQGVSGLNNPCPTGYRIPTEAEWDAERFSWGSSSQNAAGAFASPLKLPMAGARNNSPGSLDEVGIVGVYWSSTVSGSNARFFRFDPGNAGMITTDRAYGYSVRCLKD